MKLRTFTPNDVEALARVYRDAVRTLGPQAYTQEQVFAWALYPEDFDEFRLRLSRGLTLVADKDARAIAFGQLDPDDHLAFLYCSGAYARRGVASAIYSVLEAHGLSKCVRELRTEATRLVVYSLRRMDIS